MPAERRDPFDWRRYQEIDCPHWFDPHWEDRATQSPGAEDGPEEQSERPGEDFGLE